MATAHVNVKGRTSMDGRGWSAGLRKMEVGTRGAAARMAGTFSSMLGGVFAIGFLTSATRRIVQHADQIDKTAKRIGTSTDTIQKFDFAATQSGANMGDVEKAFFNTAKAIESAKQGLTPHIRAFEAFGISMQMLKVMSPEEVFLKIADAIDKAGGAMDKAKSLQDIMGRGGRALIPAFTAGFTGLAGAAPEGIDAETVANLAAFNDELDRLKREALPGAAAAVSGLATVLEMANEGTGGKGTGTAGRAKNLWLNMMRGGAWVASHLEPTGIARKVVEAIPQAGVSVSEADAQAIVDQANKSILLGRSRKETDPETADAAAAAAARAWSKPSLQLNSLQRIGAAVSQSADPIAIEKDNNTLLKTIAKNTKKIADEATDEL